LNQKLKFMKKLNFQKLSNKVSTPRQFIIEPMRVRWNVYSNADDTVEMMMIIQKFKVLTLIKT